MGSPAPPPISEETRLRSLIQSLQTESSILERIIYKNKNQHRRCPYFQFLLKVRRDVKLLQSTSLSEILNALFPIIDGRKAAQKAYLPTKLKRKQPIGKHNYQERLLGVARLLSQMVEPILKAATQISFLLAKSFFTGFSVTILALLARLRVLVQQILLDVVSVFNKVSSLSQKKQSVKLIDEGIEAFREYYPSTGDSHHALTLECVWEEDKFILIERTNQNDIRKSEEGPGPLCVDAAIQYETVNLFKEVCGDEDFNSSTTRIDTAQDLQFSGQEPSTNLSTAEETHGIGVEITNYEELTGLTSVSKNGLNVGSDSRKKRVAFVSVTKPKLSNINTDGSNKKTKLDSLMSDAMKTDDPFLSLLLGGTTKNNTVI